MDPKQPNIPSKFLKPYDPQTTESRLYETWKNKGYFNPEECIKAGVTDPNAPVFSMVLPPPNVTGTLHMGHAMMVAVEDIMVRHARMRGMRTLWIPGTDHAAIATQSKVEGEIYKKEGKRRHDLGREELLRRVHEYAHQSHDTIVTQITRLGASLDWSREAYTLDDARSHAVRTAFKKMHDLGLIYRGHRIVNWDPKGQTTISDDEIVYTEGKGKFYTFKYSKDFPISIATTRPETKVGDVAVAVHPDDARYKKFIGKEYDIDFAGEKIHIQIVGDNAVDPAFGTGAVGVTPAHSHIDWEIAQRHGLPSKQVINEFAKMSVESPLLKDKKVSDARTAVIEWLIKEGLLEKEEDINQNITTAERTGGVIEPLPKLQWFVAVDKPFTLEHSNIQGIPSGSKTTLKQILHHTVQSGEIKILPERFERVYGNWIDNLRDWCISRQIWFGHRIPVWYKGNETFIGTEAPQGSEWVQDEDTLDTWFSSGLWTFSTLGWPEKTSDLKTYHPTMMLETGYDIIFFWVARMILMTGCLLGDVPFKHVYLHGLVRNPDGSKMSKSTGAIDPLLMCDKYGTDAVRMALIVGTGPGNDTKMSEDKIRAYKNFANKLWNIARYVLTSTEGMVFEEKHQPKLSDEDAKEIETFTALLSDIKKDMDAYRYYLAAEKLYQYVWHSFADVYIEQSKKEIAVGGKNAESARWTLLYILTNSLRALHPFAPYVTEEIWTDMPVRNKNMLIVEKTLI